MVPHLWWQTLGLILFFIKLISFVYYLYLPLLYRGISFSFVCFSVSIRYFVGKQIRHFTKQLANWNITIINLFLRWLPFRPCWYIQLFFNVLGQVGIAFFLLQVVGATACLHYSLRFGHRRVQTNSWVCFWMGTLQHKFSFVLTYWCDWRWLSKRIYIFLH